MPDDFFAAKALKRCAVQLPRKRLVRLNDLFRTRSSFVRSGFYRRYMAPQKCAHGIAFFFWKRQRLICAIAILRTARQGDFSTAEMKLLRQLYPQFLAALRGIESLERERCVRADFEEVLRGLPLPTIILRWNLKPIYQNNAAREFCALWEKGPEEAKRTKASSPIPVEILDRCRVLKQEWMDARRRTRSEQRTDFKEEQVRHPRSPHLRRDNSTQADQFRRRGGTTFSHRLRKSLPKRRTLWATQAFPVARHCSAHTARTGSCATGLRRAKQQGDRSKCLLEFADSEKAPALRLSQTPACPVAHDCVALADAVMPFLSSTTRTHADEIILRRARRNGQS